MAGQERNVGKKRFQDLLSKQKKVIKKPYEDKIMKIAKDQKKAKAEAVLDSMRKRLEQMRQPMRTGPRKITDRGPSRIMKPMPLTPEMLEKLKDKKFKKPTLPSVEDRGKRKEMKPFRSGGAAGQTKSTKRPMQSIFQQLKKAQMHRKMGTMGKK